MKMKNKTILSLISFLLVVALVFLALPQGVSASSNDILNGGVSSKQQLKNKFDNAYHVFTRYGIKKADIDSLKDGVVHKSGNIYVGSQKVATGAKSTGRDEGKSCSHKVNIPNSKPVWEGTTQCRFASSTSKLAAFVKLDKDGRFQYAIIKECGNPTTGTPTKPKPKPPVPSIKINKSVNKGNPLLGEQFTYTFTAKNTGETALKNVTITDPAPKGGNGVQLIEFLPSETAKGQKGLTVTKNKVTVNVGNLAKNASTQTYSIKAKFIKESNNYIKNQVCVTGQSTNNEAKPQQVKDCATAQNKTTDVNIDIKKSVNKPLVDIGEQFTYTIKVTNKSQKDLTNLTIYDPATPPIEFIPNSGGGVGAKISSTMYTKTGVSLKKGETKTFSFKAKFTKAVTTDVINKACIKTDQNEQFCATAFNRPKLPVEVAKSVDKSEVKIGEEFTYTITLTNTTTVDISNLGLLDVLKTPDYLELVQGSGTNGLVVQDGGIWSVKTGIVLKAGETQTFTMKAKYKEGTPSNAVGINEVCTTGATPNSCATASNKPITPTPPAITITKDVSKEAVHIGEVFTYTVKVTNTGETDIPALNMLDAQPKGIEFIPGTATNGASINSGDPFNTGQESMWFGKANFPLKAGETQEFSFQAKLVEEMAGDIVNTVCASDGAQATACDDAKNIMAPIEPPVIPECAEGIPVGDERCIPAPEPVTPAVIASTGPGAVAASIVGISAIGYGARQWIASRRAIQEATKELYK